MICIHAGVLLARTQPIHIGKRMTHDGPIHKWQFTSGDETQRYIEVVSAFELPKNSTVQSTTEQTIEFNEGAR